MEQRRPAPPLTVESIGQFIRAQRRAAELSVRELAERAGVSNPYLSQIERGLRKPSAEILRQIAQGLRISAETLYARVGILDDRPDPPDVMAAVHADRTLTDRQRRVLLDIYAAFQHENAAAHEDAAAQAHAGAQAHAEAQAQAHAEAQTQAQPTAAAGDDVDRRHAEEDVWARATQDQGESTRS